MTEDGRILEPANGKRVTNPDIYEALLKLDMGLGERFTAYQREMVVLHERITQVEANLLEHKKNHQTISARLSSLYGLVAAVVAAAVAATMAALKVR